MVETLANHLSHPLCSYIHLLTDSALWVGSQLFQYRDECLQQISKFVEGFHSDEHNHVHPISLHIDLHLYRTIQFQSYKLV